MLEMSWKIKLINSKFNITLFLIILMLASCSRRDAQPYSIEDEDVVIYVSNFFKCYSTYNLPIANCCLFIVFIEKYT